MKSEETCCELFRDAMRLGDEVGFSIHFDPHLPPLGGYKLVHRSIANEEGPKLPVVPVKILITSEIVIKFCPWCGHLLTPG